MTGKHRSGEDRYYHLILLAENNQGYQNLMKIVSKGFVDGFYYKPRVDLEILRQYHEGIIALSACLAGEVQRYLAERACTQQAKAKSALRYEEIFGKNNFLSGAAGSRDSGSRRQLTRRLLRMSAGNRYRISCDKRCSLYICGGRSSP